MAATLHRAVCGAAAIGLAAVVPARAEAPTAPSLNLYGAPGLVDMPSGEAQPDGEVTLGYGLFAGLGRTTLSFQLLPRVSGSFRYTGIRNWNRYTTPGDGLFDGFDTYYDRSFDLRILALREGRYLPAVTFGLQDFAGTGLFSGEYVAATKHVLPSVKVTAGLGWGRLGTFGDIGSPFGDRSRPDVGRGGKPNFKDFFRGPAAPFAGIEWTATDKIGLKLEYSSDAYFVEAERRGIFERKSPFNLGVEYRVNDAVKVGGYYLYGSELGLSVQLAFNPTTRPGDLGLLGPGPLPVKVRPGRAADPAAWSTSWAATPATADRARATLAGVLGADGITLEALSLAPEVATVRIVNRRYDAEAQAIGRTARALAALLPASVETFRIEPVVAGVATSSVVLRRRDLEALEFAPDSAAALLARTRIEDAGGPLPPRSDYAEGRYPRFTYGLGPYVRFSTFDPDDPIRADLGARLTGAVDIAPGLVVAGALTQRLVGTLDDVTRVASSRLPRVRTDTYLYDRQDGVALETLTAAYYVHPRGPFYGRLTAGYLEQQFGGVSAEVLWKPVARRLALGAEVNYARQRDFDQRFGFRDYDVVTGHASAYYDFGGGYHGEVDAGRYLAGDYGATFTLTREFANGWNVGAFATFTDVSAEEFGEGSFDKGIFINIPVTWAIGQPSRRSAATVIRPITRDGGARLGVNGRLEPLVRSYDAEHVEGQWGRVWR